jgi:general secretion pathway protein G
LIITLAILAMLAAATLPLVYNTVKRNRETALRRGLRELRDAIDNYKRFNDSTVPPGQLIPIQERTMTGYPKNLKILVDGFVPANRVDDKKLRFLRRMPVDPMTESGEWGVKSSTDDPDSNSTNDEDVFDVYSKSDGVGLNGTKYRDW